MIKIGTLCYVVPSCLASPKTQCAVGKIVEVVSLPYDAPDGTYLPGTYYDVRFEGRIFYCRSDKLRPISDPDADVTEWQTETVRVSKIPAPSRPTTRHPVQVRAREVDRYVLIKYSRRTLPYIIRRRAPAR
jgi:hypothetical protein